MGILMGEYSWTRVLSGFFSCVATGALVVSVVMFWGGPEMLGFYMWFSGFAATILTLYGAKSLTQKKLIGGENVVNRTQVSERCPVEEGNANSIRMRDLGS